MLESKLCFSLGILTHFIDNSLDLSYTPKKITGFELLTSLTEASAYNTYIETIDNKADILYMRIKESEKGIICDAYLNYIKRISKKRQLNEKKVMLAFDYTDEDFYGEVQGFDIHGWTKKDAVSGKFKFITCSIVSDEIPEKIPLISLPIRLGHYKSDVILRCLSLIKDYIGEIELILFDRGFYDKDLMYELNKNEFNYLIFVPKAKDKKNILASISDGEQVAIYNDFKINKDKSTFTDENVLIFLKKIYDKKSKNNYDWVFATNVDLDLLKKVIAIYKKRWRIETMFRVQDEARIKCKSKDMKVRYFIFLFEQMLQTMWICFYKEELSFKQFLITLAKESRNYTKRLESGNK